MVNHPAFVFWQKYILSRSNMWNSRYSRQQALCQIKYTWLLPSFFFFFGQKLSKFLGHFLKQRLIFSVLITILTKNVTYYFEMNIAYYLQSRLLEWGVLVIISLCQDYTNSNFPRMVIANCTPLTFSQSWNCVQGLKGSGPQQQFCHTDENTRIFTMDFVSACHCSITAERCLR